MSSNLSSSVREGVSPTTGSLGAFLITSLFSVFKGKWDEEVTSQDEDPEEGRAFPSTLDYTLKFICGKRTIATFHFWTQNHRGHAPWRKADTKPIPELAIRPTRPGLNFTSTSFLTGMKQPAFSLACPRFPGVSWRVGG